MSELANSPEAARLDELAAVTKEYATYSRTSFGFAAVGVGIWILAAVLMETCGAWGWAHVGYVLVPLAWLVLSRNARAYYQRHGVVVEHEPEPSGFAGSRAFALTMACILLVMYAGILAIVGRRWARAGGIPGEIALTVGVAGLLAAAWLAPRWSVGVKHAWLTAGLSGFSGSVIHFASGDAGFAALWQAVHALWVVLA